MSFSLNCIDCIVISNCIVTGNFNGCSVNGYEVVHGGYRWGERNKDGERLLEIAHSFDIVIENTFYMKGDEKLITYKSGGNATVIDHVLIQKPNEKSAGCESYPW